MVSIIAMSEPPGTSENAEGILIKSGPLYQQLCGVFRRTWQLKCCSLHMFDNPRSKLLRIYGSEKQFISGERCSEQLMLYHSGSSGGRLMVAEDAATGIKSKRHSFHVNSGRGRTNKRYLFAANSREEMLSWINCLNAVIHIPMPLPLSGREVEEGDAVEVERVGDSSAGLRAKMAEAEYSEGEEEGVVDAQSTSPLAGAESVGDAGAGSVQCYQVSLRCTSGSVKCNLATDTTYVILLNSTQLSLARATPRDDHRMLYVWPYRYIRRYGRNEQHLFSFEAGRKCESGEGLFTFHTPHAGDIFHFIMAQTVRLKREELSGSGSVDYVSEGDAEEDNVMNNNNPNTHSPTQQDVIGLYENPAELRVTDGGTSLTTGQTNTPLTTGQSPTPLTTGQSPTPTPLTTGQSPTPLTTGQSDASIHYHSVDICKDLDTSGPVPEDNVDSVADGSKTTMDYIRKQDGDTTCGPLMSDVGAVVSYEDACPVDTSKLGVTSQCDSSDSSSEQLQDKLDSLAAPHSDKSDYSDHIGHSDKSDYTDDIDHSDKSDYNEHIDNTGHSVKSDYSNKSDHIDASDQPTAEVNVSALKAMFEKKMQTRPENFLYKTWERDRDHQRAVTAPTSHVGPGTDTGGEGHEYDQLNFKLAPHKTAVAAAVGEGYASLSSPHHLASSS